ncbi:MAG: metal-dependent transcriptional regulator [Alkalispirochaeta sp.]
MHEKAISQSVEMYLVTIYRLTEHDKKASTHDIAGLLGVSLPSVTGQLKRLTEKGYVDYAWREGASLTESGRLIALGVLRKNRLIKTFLYRQAGYGLDELFDEACVIEHVVSDRFADALEKMLDHPERDPHGLPIPDDRGNVPPTMGTRLEAIAPPCEFETVRLNEVSQRAVAYCGEIGLTPPQTAHYRNRDEEHFHIVVNGNEIYVPRAIAEHVLVKVTS